jgi:dynein light chain roadblock-type
MASVLIEEVFNRISTHKGVEGIIIADINGVPIKSTFKDEQTTYFYSTSASFFIKRCSTLVKILINKEYKKSDEIQNKQDDTVKEELSFIRLRTKFNEIMIAPDKDFLLLVVQNSTLSSN